MRIRRARRADLTRIMSIEKQSFGADAWDRDCFEEYLAHPAEACFVVASDQGVVVGYAVAITMNPTAELDSIAVAKGKRRTGVARQLLAHIIQRLRRKHVPALVLMVRRDNQAAIRLYRGVGFARVRRVNDYFPDGAPAWRMRLNLLN